MRTVAIVIMPHDSNLCAWWLPNTILKSNKSFPFLLRRLTSLQPCRDSSRGCISLTSKLSRPTMSVQSSSTKKIFTQKTLFQMSLTGKIQQQPAGRPLQNIIYRKIQQQPASRLIQGPNESVSTVVSWFQELCRALLSDALCYCFATPGEVTAMRESYQSECICARGVSTRC